jgi:D-3-phosphoglycerate dehydrogenase
MTMHKIYILDQFHPAGVEWIKQRADVVCWDDPRIHDWHQHAQGVMVRTGKISGEDFRRAKVLKVVSKQGVGVNNMDLAAAKACGITVCNTPGINREAVADMALGMALSLSRRITEFDRMIRSGKAFNRNDFMGLEMWGKTIGIVGMGNTGTEVAKKYRQAFDAKILAFDPYVSDTHWADIPHERIRDLTDLWPRVDVLSIHVPYTPQTHHLVNAAVLAQLKPRAILVNAARGDIVDEDALYACMRTGHLYGAGLDVWSDVEPPLATHPLLTLPNVIATPHAAGSTEETQIKSSLRVAEQLLHVMNGGEPFHRVV